MKLKKVRICKFRNFLDSGEVPIEPDITCLVGKNESGKTALLHAVYRLNPVRPNVQFSILEHYPAWIEKKDRLKGVDQEQFVPIMCTFELEDVDIEKIEDQFGSKSIKSKGISFERRYNGELVCQVDIDEERVISHILDSVDQTPELNSLSKVSTIDDLNQAISDLESSQNSKASDDTIPESNEIEGTIKQTLVSLRESVQSVLGGKSLIEAVTDIAQQLLPKFLYFDEYSKLPYSCGIQRILKTDQKELSDSELTARALLNMAAAADDYLLNPDYERRKRELENVANALTSDILKYWSQNPELRVQPDITQKTVNGPQGQQSVLDELKLRIWDQRHFLSLPFDEHSSGFRWFFSFLAAFSEYEYKEEPIVILLDEPALNLHARAQTDFLRFIEERLAPKCQVVYTTHSPFMIQPGFLNRVRLIEDHGKDTGAKVTLDVLSTDPDTLFPLQGALGYDIAQNLFIAPNNLVVEGTSDFTYLDIISRHLESLTGRTPLDNSWTILPVGGVDLIPTFIALLGTHLNLGVLIDSSKGGNQKISRLANQGYIVNSNIVTIGQILGRSQADIEDLFHPQDYLNLYNGAFGKELSTSVLNGDDPIVKQIARAEGIDSFDHGKPAEYLLRNRDVIYPNLDQETIDNFDSLFNILNSLLASFEKT
jgi:ABC-type transport system involved in cytochrome c biogenesis ATPase subunit